MKDTNHKNRRKLFDLHRNVLAAGFVSLFMDISSEMVYPLVPLFLATAIGANKATIGLIEGVAESTASILKVFSGWFSDRMGKRKLFMMVGYGISVISRPIIALSASWGEVFAARFIDRLGKGVRTSPRDAIIADSVEHADLGKAYGLHRAMDTLGAVIGPGAAFLILYFLANNIRLVFWLSIIPGSIAVVLIVILITDKAETVPVAMKKTIQLCFSGFDRRYKMFLLTIILFSIGNSSDVFLILRAENLGVSKTLIPVSYLLFNVVYFASSLPFGLLADKLGKRRMIASGFILFSLVYLGAGMAYKPLHAWLMFAFYGIFRGMTDGTERAYVASLAPPGQRATAFGIYHMAIGLSLLPASIIGGLLWDRVGPWATFFFGSAASLSAFGVFLSGGHVKE